VSESSDSTPGGRLDNLFTAAVFVYFKATASRKGYHAYYADYDSDTFSVEAEADSGTGDPTTTVEGEH
jgi:hypothetical protein